MSESITIVIDQPDKAIHPNGRTRHWGHLAAKVRKCRESTALVAAFEARELWGRPPEWREAVCQITIYYGFRQKQQDDDNLIAWLKPAFDGLEDAGIVVNDRNLRHERPVHKRDKLRPRIELRVWEESRVVSTK